MISYANDVKLAELEQQIISQRKWLSESLTNGLLDKAFLIAHQMEKTLDLLKTRLNEIKYDARR